MSGDSFSLYNPCLGLISMKGSIVIMEGCCVLGWWRPSVIRSFLGLYEARRCCTLRPIVGRASPYAEAKNSRFEAGKLGGITDPHLQGSHPTARPQCHETGILPVRHRFVQLSVVLGNLLALARVD